MRKTADKRGYSFVVEFVNDSVFLKMFSIIISLYYDKRRKVENNLSRHE